MTDHLDNSDEEFLEAEYDLDTTPFAELILNIPRADHEVNLFQMSLTPEDSTFIEHDGLEFVALVVKKEAADELLQVCEAGGLELGNLDKEATLEDMLSLSHETVWSAWFDDTLLIIGMDKAARALYTQCS